MKSGMQTDHVVPTRTYYAIYALLLACTYLTWQVAFFDLGAMNTVAAMTIAVLKAVVVVLFFMHVKYSTRLTWVVVIGGVFWLGILLVLLFSDYLTRGWRTYG
jgi:cytochrome c oxidase subunit IV